MMPPRLLFPCFLALAPFAVFAQAKELEGVRAPASTVCPSPEEAQRKMSVPEGYAVRCFAHEPMVVNPVAMTWDARGRLWVVEAYEYPEGSPHPAPFGAEAQDDQYHPVPQEVRNSKFENETQEAFELRISNLPRDRVIILEDTDNDGQADKRTVFVQGLNLASAILCGDDGIYVGQQPHLLHFQDKDGDDQPDAWRVVLTGFGREDTHELVNSFCWGPDGWLYMTHGVFTNSKVRRPGQPESEGFKFDAGIGRCRPMNVVPSLLKTSEAPETAAPPWEFEVFADGTSNPWGCDYDAAGNFFVSACVIDHFFHMAPGGIYIRQGGAPENPYAYEQLPSIVKHKHFRAAYAGVQIYQGGVYPQDTWGHAFIGNIHDNAIHEEVLTPVGATFKCEPRRDFLRANDGWFRPVSTQTGPDGNLWIMDWCDKYPCYQNAKANPEGVDRGRGRIWRVVAAPSSDVGVKSSKVAAPSSDTRAKIPEVGAKSSERGVPGSEVGAKSSEVAAPSSTAGAKSSDGGAKSSDLGVPSSGRGEKAASDALLAGREASERSADTPARKEPPLANAESADLRADNRAELARQAKPTSAPVPSRPSKDMNLAKLPTPELVKTLEHPNNWMRRMARRQLVERLINSEEPAPPNLAALWTNLPAKQVNMEALWTQVAAGRSLSAVDPTMQESAAVRTWIAHAAGDPSTDWSISSNTLLRLPADPDPSVRYASLIGFRRRLTGHLTTGKIQDQERASRVLSLLQLAILRGAGKDDPSTAFAWWMVIEPLLASNPKTTLQVLSLSFDHSQPLSQTLTLKMMRRLAETRQPANMDLAIEFLTAFVYQPALLNAGLEGLVKGQEGGIIKPTKDSSASLAKWRSSSDADVRKHAQTLAVLWGDDAAVKQMLAELHDAAKPEKERIVLLQSLQKVKTETVRQGLKPLLVEQGSVALSIAAIRAAADLGGDDYLPALLGLAAAKDFSLRGAALEALSSRASWTHAMLEAIAATKVSAAGFPAPVRRALATSKDNAIRDHAFKVLGAWQDSSDDVKALIAQKKQACLTGEPDMANGKLMFQSTCMVCHEFHGGGQKVGPDLIGSGRSNLDAILANVIDPNQIIGNGYENFTLATKDGRTLAGRVVEDTPSQVKLLGAGGATQVIPRDQIASLTNSKQSLMPMGFGGLPDAAFRDLIWYILAPPEEGPLTEAKKQLLIKGVEVPEAASSKPQRPNWHAIDWESVSNWNPKWKVEAPDFERTPLKLAEYHGRTNVLLMHPFPDKVKPAALEQRFKVDAAKARLKFSVAADDRGDWKLRVLVDGQEVKQQAIDHSNPRWQDISIDLSGYADREVTVRLEAHATGWSMEFSYWHDVRLE